MKAFVEDVILVSDTELLYSFLIIQINWLDRSILFFIVRRQTVKLAYNRGLVVEPSGAAALAAVLTGKVETFVCKIALC